MGYRYLKTPMGGSCATPLLDFEERVELELRPPHTCSVSAIEVQLALPVIRWEGSICVD